MTGNSPKKANEDFSSPLKENNNMTCKDGFCFLPNIDESQRPETEGMNIFDPI